MMERVNAIREKLGATTRFRISFTPLFPSAFTALPVRTGNGSSKARAKEPHSNLREAKELGWATVSVTERSPRIKHINQGGRT